MPAHRPTMPFRRVRTRAADRVPRQLRVPHGDCHLGVPEQPADRREPLAECEPPGRERVTAILRPHVPEPGAGADAMPEASRLRSGAPSTFPGMTCGFCSRSEGCQRARPPPPVTAAPRAQGHVGPAQGQDLVLAAAGQRPDPRCRHAVVRDDHVLTRLCTSNEMRQLRLGLSDTNRTGHRVTLQPWHSNRRTVTDHR